MRYVELTKMIVIQNHATDKFGSGLTFSLFD